MPQPAAMCAAGVTEVLPSRSSWRRTGRRNRGWQSDSCSSWLNRIVERFPDSCLPTVGPMNLARALTVTALAAGALHVSYLSILYFMQDALIYPGTRNRVDSVAPRPEGADLFHISTTEANVEALFLPAAADAKRHANPR